MTKDQAITVMKRGGRMMHPKLTFCQWIAATIETTWNANDGPKYRTEYIIDSRGHCMDGKLFLFGRASVRFNTNEWELFPVQVKTFIELLPDAFDFKAPYNAQPLKPIQMTAAKKEEFAKKLINKKDVDRSRHIDAILDQYLKDELFQIIRYHYFDLEIKLQLTPSNGCAMWTIEIFWKKEKIFFDYGETLWKRFYKARIAIVNEIGEKFLYKYGESK